LQGRHGGAGVQSEGHRSDHYDQLGGAEQGSVAKRSMRRKCLIRKHYFAVDSIRETRARPSSSQASPAVSLGAWLALSADPASARLPASCVSTRRARECVILRSNCLDRSTSLRGSAQENCALAMAFFEVS
jgi:hypothetical protein